jgi:hypothetical protein
MAGAELDADHTPIRARGQGPAETGGGLGQEGRDPPVQDPVGLVDPPVDRETHHYPIGTGLQNLDVEEFVDAFAAVGEERPHARVGPRGGSGHRRMLTVPR